MTNPFPLPRSERETGILVGNGSATYGPFAFKIFDEADVLVWTKPAGEQDFARTTPVVTKVNDLPFDVFTIRFSEVLPDTTQFFVRSQQVPERNAGVKSGTRVDPDALEKELTRIAATEQELRRDTLAMQPGITEDRALVLRGGMLAAGPDIEAENKAAQDAAALAAEEAAAAEASRIAAAGAELRAAASATEAAVFAELVGAAVYDFSLDSDPDAPGYDWSL